MGAHLRIAIADDHVLFREGLKALLSLRPEIVVVAETDRADAVVPMVTGTPCDVLLLDLQMDRTSLIDVETAARSAKVIIVTASERGDDALAAVRAGASGVVFKRFAVETLVDALGAVAAGQVWVPPALQTRLVAELREPAPQPLTTREREIIRHVALGLRNAEVGAKLFISEDTVKTHLNNIFAKLGIRDRVQLTLYALRLGIAGLDEHPG